MTEIVQPAVMGDLEQSPTVPKLPYLSVQEHRTSSSILGAAGPWMFANEESATFLLPPLETASDLLAANLATSRALRKSPCLWLSCWSLWPAETAQQGAAGMPEEAGIHKTALDVALAPQLDIVAMIDQGRPAATPVFLFVPKTAPISSTDTLHARVRGLVERLANLVPFDSVPSVFGPSTVSMTFSRMWEEVTGMKQRPEPSRTMQLVHCRPRPPSSSLSAVNKGAQEGISGGAKVRSLLRIRVASLEDVKELAELLHIMTNATPNPVTIDAEAFASHLITSSCVHLLEVLEEHISSSYWRVVSVCEIARHGRRSARVGRIYTLADVRRQGYATYLLKSILDSLFQTGTTSVFAYLPVGEARAESLFLRTGFHYSEQEEFVEWAFEHAGPTFW